MAAKSGDQRSNLGNRTIALGGWASLSTATSSVDESTLSLSSSRTGGNRNSVLPRYFFKLFNSYLSIPNICISERIRHFLTGERIRWMVHSYNPDFECVSPAAQIAKKIRTILDCYLGTEKTTNELEKAVGPQSIILQQRLVHFLVELGCRCCSSDCRSSCSACCRCCANGKEQQRSQHPECSLRCDDAILQFPSYR